jgi:uncharacterized protein YkwD
VPRMRTTMVVMASLAALAGPISSAEAQERTPNDVAAERMLDAINDVRAQNELDAFRESASLMGSAERFSHWLMANERFGHLESIQASHRFALLGEALAMHTRRDFGVRGTLAQWLNSPPHRALVLSSTMRWAGTGVTRGRIGSRPATVWVLQVGRL